MAARRVCIYICLLCLCLHVRSSKSVFTVDDSFVAKHVMKSNLAVNNIPYRVILGRFKTVQDYPGFLNNEYRSRHSFLVTSNLNDLKNYLIGAFKIYYTKGKFTTSRPINFDNLGILDFRIAFNVDEEKFRVLDKSCRYSSKGTLMLGAVRAWYTNYIYVINHLSDVHLHEPKMCNSTLQSYLSKSLPPGTCG